MDNQSAATADDNDSEAKMLRVILPAILPSILQHRTKAFQSAANNGQEPVQDEKFWGPVIAAAISAAPSIYRSVRGRRKDFEPEQPEPVTGKAMPQAPEADDKIWPMAIAAAISAAPSIYRAVRGKDFEPTSGATAQGAAPQRTTPQGAAPQPPATGAPRAGIAVGEPSGAGPQGPVDDKTWGQVVAAAITAAPDIYRAVRGKDFQTDTTGSSQAPAVDDKVMQILPAILPGIVHAMQQRKDFEPEGKAVAAPPAALQGPVDDKTWGQVVAAAITAAPDIYRAVRGKDFALT